MSNLAIKLDAARAKRQTTPDAKRTHLRLVEPVQPEPVVAASYVDATPGLLTRFGHKVSRTYALTLIIVAIVSVFCVGLGVGKFEDDLQIRERAAALMAKGLQPIMTDSGEFRRDNLK